MILIDSSWLVLGGALLFFLGACTGLIVGWFGYDEIEARKLAQWDGRRADVR